MKQHQAIRDDVIRVFRGAGLLARSPQAGSYLFPTLPPLTVNLADFVRLLRHQAKVIVTPGTEWAHRLIAQSSDRMRTVSASTFHRIAQLLWKPQNASSTWSVVTGRERRSCRSVRLRCVSFRFEIGIRLSRGCVSERPPIGARHCRALFCTGGWQCASLGFKPLAHRGHHELGARADSGRPPCRDRS